MANSFAATVKLSDLNDFIGPGAACVNPLFSAPSSTSTTTADKPAEPGSKPKVSLVMEGADDAAMEILPRNPASAKKTFGLIKSVASSFTEDQPKQKAQVSLSDCLACSGCVTSAESVLIEQQSPTRFLATAAEAKTAGKLVIVSVATQIRASFAEAWGIEPAEAHELIATFLKRRVGVDRVVDLGGVASDLHLFETAREFVRRFQAHQQQQQQQALPLLSSSCPGWVCYAEKTHGELVIPYLSAVRSPQQLAGVFCKTVLPALHGTDRARVYHASIMMCPDKKLEASRSDFATSEGDPDVDCVLTATELLGMMETALGEESLVAKLRALSAESQAITTSPHEWGQALAKPGVALTRSEGLVPSGSGLGSGGALSFVFRYAALHLFGVALDPRAPLPMRKGRNPDTWTVELEMDNKIVLSFATAYGFRNIQEIVRKTKRGQLPHHFVEVLACPGGCPNGGGMLPPLASTSSGELPEAKRRALATRVAETMASKIPTIQDGDLREDDDLLGVYRELEWVADRLGTSTRALLETSYHAVAKIETDQGIVAAGW